MIDSLRDRMTLEHGAANEFLELLNLEADAMANGRFSDLPQLTERKSKLADEIVILSLYRETEQISLGYPAGYSGAVAASAAGGPLLQEVWGRLQTCAAQVRERNLANGVVIHANLDFTRQAINFLKSANGSLYGPDGTHSSGTASGNRLAAG